MSKKFLIEGRRKVQQKKDEIRQQRDAVAEYVNDLCDKAEVMADDLIGENNSQRFMARFKPVMSSLEEISNNLFMIQASLPGDETETDLSSYEDPPSDNESGQNKTKEQDSLQATAQEPKTSVQKGGILEKSCVKTEKTTKQDSEAGGGDNKLNTEKGPMETKDTEEITQPPGSDCVDGRAKKPQETSSPKKRKGKSKAGRTKKSPSKADSETSGSSPVPKSLQSSKESTPEPSGGESTTANKVPQKPSSPTPSTASTGSSKASSVKSKAASARSKVSSIKSKASAASAAATKAKSKPAETFVDYGMGPRIGTLSFQNGATTEVLVTEVMSPSYFWAQPVSDAIGDLMTEMEVFNERLKAGAPGYTLPVQPVAGMVVSACFTQDDQWYRARVTGIYQNLVAGSDDVQPQYELDVLYIDYGNRERLPLERVRPLMSSFSKLPAQAFVCSLSEIAPVGSSGLVWPVPSIQEFGVNVCGSRRFTAVVRALQECPLIFIELYYAEKVLPKLLPPQSSTGPVANIMVSLADVMINKSRGQKTENENIAEKYEQAVSRNPTLACGPQRPGLVGTLDEYQVHALQCPNIESVQQTFKTRLKAGQLRKAGEPEPGGTSCPYLEPGATSTPFPVSVPEPTRVAEAELRQHLSPVHTSTPEKKPDQSPVVVQPQVVAQVPLEVHTPSVVQSQPPSVPASFHLPAAQPSPTSSTSSKKDKPQPTVTETNTTDHDKTPEGDGDSNINHSSSVSKKDSSKDVEILPAENSDDTTNKWATWSGKENIPPIVQTTEPQQGSGTPADWCNEVADETFDLLLDQEMEKEEHSLEVHALEKPNGSDMVKNISVDADVTRSSSPDDNEETVCYDNTVSEAAGDKSQVEDLTEKVKRALAFDSTSENQEEVKPAEKSVEEETPEIPIQQRLKEFGLPSKLPKACGYAESFGRWMSSVSSVSKTAASSSQSNDTQDTSKLTDENPSQSPSVDLSYEEMIVSSKVQQYKPHVITLSEDACVHFLMSFVENPLSFWIHLVNESSQKALDTLMEELNDYYKSANKVVMKKFFDDHELKVFDVCCAKFAEDNRFYRAEVVSIRYEMEESGTPLSKRKANHSADEKQISSTQKRISRVKVFYIDYGNSEWVPRKLIYPLPPKFLDIPPQALCCKLADIHPVAGKGDGGDEAEDGQWSKSVIKKFVELTGFKKPLLGYVIGHEPCASVSVTTESALVLCVVDTGGADDLWVNEELVRLGMAISHSMSALPKDYNIPQEALAGPESDDIPADWNPMVEDYLSIRNSYAVDIDDAQVALTGYKTEDDNKICANFNRPGGCRREMCPFFHIKYSDYTTDKKEVFCINDSETKMIAPEEGSWVAVELSAIFNPGHFYAQFPFGTKPIIEIMKEESLRTSDEGYAGSCTTDSLDNLMNALNEEYKGSEHRNTDLTIFALGEVVVAKFSEDGRWYRARVTDTNPEAEKVKVFYIDYGNAEWLPESQIRVIEAQYTHLPPQAVECFLPVDPVSSDSSWTKQAKDDFRALAEGKVLFANVLSRGINNIMSVELYDTEGEQDVCINNLLVEKKHGTFVPPFPPKPLPQSRDKEGRVSPVYIPG